MEVHHPHHITHKKKWGEYLLEFFMLFLAVFLGFMAENIREGVVERHREKQFMKSMLEDLAGDRVEMKKILSNINSSTESMDSMLVLLTAKNITDEAIIKSYQYTFPALVNIPIVFNDRTITQLKNSGSMRMIINQKVNDVIIKYWNQIEVLTKSLERHNAYRTRGRDMETKIFNTAVIFMNNDKRIAKPSRGVELINNDAYLIREYTNVIAYCGVILNGLHSQITQLDSLASEVIQFIKKEYHFR